MPPSTSFSHLPKLRQSASRVAASSRRAQDARTLLTVAAVCLGVAGCASAARSASYPDAEFIFRGTTVVPRASTINAEDVSDLAIVRVDEILHAPPALAPLRGSDITVRLRDPARARAGDQRLYFANGWHWGESIGVTEVSSIDSATTEKVQTIRPDIERAREAHADSVLLDRVRAAELVVAGKVVAVRPSKIPRTPTEHDPEWREADIEVTAVLKGKISGQRLTILFPGTDDPMWYRAPRFTVGTEGIFILHRLRLPGFAALPYLTAPQLEDFRPMSDESRIRRLLQQ